MSKRQSNPANSQPKQQTLFGRIVRGQIISAELFSRYWYVILLVISLALLSITTKYECQTKMEEIRRLEDELEIVKTERIRAKSLYMSRTRESAMNELVDSLHLELNVQDKPPYKISSHK